MPDISQMTSDLRGLPDQALQHELTQPSGAVPSYLVLAEAQRRQLMRQAAQKQQTQPGTVLDDVVRNMMSGQPPQGGPPAPVGMVPPKGGQPGPPGMPGTGPPQQGPPGMPGAAPPQQMGMARGGAIRFADGDLFEDDDGEEEYQPQAQGSADRAMPEPDVDGWVDKYSKKYGVDPKVARSMMAQESGAQGQRAVSGKGARGLFQLMPDTAKEMGVDPNDPEQNVEGGIHYFRKMLDRFQGDVPKALAAYNAGPGRVDQYGGIPPFKETQNYVSAIQKKLNTSGLPDSMAGQLQPRLLRDQSPPAAQAAPAAPAATATDEPKPVPPMPPAVEQKEAVQSSDGDDGDDGDGEDGGTTATPVTPVKPASYVMPSAREFDPYNPANIDKQRQLYYTIFGGSPERQQQLETQRSATVAQLHGLQQDAINRYRNQSPWEFLANIGAGMGESHQLSLPLMFAQGVGKAWQASDEQQNRALTQAESLQQHIDAIQNVGGTERERMGRDLVTLLGQQAKTPGGAAKFEDFVKMPGATYGSMDPKQAPGPGMMGVPDPGHPGFGVWISQNQATQAAKGQQLTGMFEKDFLPGWAEEHGTTTDKMDGTQRKQAFKDYRASMVDPSIKEAAQEIAKGIMDGTTPPDLKGLYRYGGQVRSILHQNGYDLTTSMRDWQNLQKYYSTLNGASQTRLRQSTEFVSETLPYVRKLYQDWQATGLPTGFKEFNRGALVAATNLPGEQGTRAQLLLAQINDLTSELGTMYKGGNSSTDESLRLAGENLKAEWNPKTFMAALGQLETNVKIRKNSMANVAPMGVTPGSQYMPKPQGETPAAGGKPPAGALDNLQPGHVRTFKNGQRWRKKADGSVEQVQ